MIRIGRRRAIVIAACQHLVVGPTMKLLARGAKFWQSKRTSFYSIDRGQTIFQPDVKALFQLVRDGGRKFGVWRRSRRRNEGWGAGQGVGSILVKISEEDDVLQVIKWMPRSAVDLGGS
ncbi:hypothetical protein BJ170DRAFT_272202 [Xylariales sp. AK1849]|nr:hypothetical protein BJ170DRAFT_272202 [Xylariales sp. AK1849]